MKRVAQLMLNAVIPLTILTGGAFAAVWLFNSGTQAKRKPHDRNAVLVEVSDVRLVDRPTAVEAMGLIMPAREVVLRPRVSGEIVAISEELLPGGRLKAGDMVARIDPTDYELALKRQESELARARSAVQLELGQQSIAREEFALLGEDLDDENRDLVLRKPQLEDVEATVEAAEVAVARARLDLERTTVTAPFDAVVKSFDVNLGAQVTVNTTIATLVGTGEFWVEVLVPVDQLSRIVIPRSAEEEGAAARVFLKPDPEETSYREGRVIRLATDLQEEGRMARVLVAIEDPLGLKAERGEAPPLIIGTYTRVEIEGIPVTRAAEVDRNALHNGNQVWIMNDKDELEVRSVAIAFKQRDNVLVTDGLNDGDQLITTDLAAAVPGMPLRTAESGDADAP